MHFVRFCGSSSSSAEWVNDHVNRVCLRTVIYGACDPDICDVIGSTNWTLREIKMRLPSILHARHIYTDISDIYVVYMGNRIQIIQF